MGSSDFEFEFYSKDVPVRDDIRSEVEERLRSLTKGHRDMIGASVTIEQDGHKTEEPYRARVMAFIRPEDVKAADRGKTPEQALKRAVSEVERQVREGRERRAAKNGRATAD